MKRNFDKDLVTRIRDYLDRKPEIYSAYLFGSHAAKRTRNTSDIDIAILVDDHILKDSILFRSRLNADLQNLTGRRTDVVILNQANLLIRAQVFEKGIILYEHDPDRRALCQAQSMGLYYDYKRYLNFHAQQLNRKIQEAGLG